MSILTELETYVLKCLSDRSLSFGSASFEKLNSLLNSWLHELTICANSSDFLSVRLPFTKHSFFWPKTSYGNIDSMCNFQSLEFGMWLTYIFTGNYRSFWDVGAHQGIDTCVMSALYPQSTIHSFEPDPLSFNWLERILTINCSSYVTAINAGLSPSDSEAIFTRVKGNTMASHISGYKGSHGEIEEFSVLLRSYKNFPKPDFAKINIEGYEKILVPSFSAAFAESTPMSIEIHSSDDMNAVFEFANLHNLTIYTQSSGFRKQTDISTMPVSNKEGYVYLSSKDSDYAFPCF